MYAGHDLPFSNMKHGTRLILSASVDGLKNRLLPDSLVLDVSSAE